MKGVPRSEKFSLHKKEGFAIKENLERPKMKCKI